MKMLSGSATKYFGCCSACARGVAHESKPQRKERRQARAREKAALKREVQDQRADG